MSVDPGLQPFIVPALSLLGSALLAGVSFILRTLSQQNRAMSSQSQALAVLIARVDPAIANISRTQTLELTVGKLDERLRAVEDEQKYLRGAQHAPTITVN